MVARGVSGELTGPGRSAGSPPTHRSPSYFPMARSVRRQSSSSTSVTSTSPSRITAWRTALYATSPMTAPALLDLPNAVGADNLADYHLHVYASLLQGVFRITLNY